MGLLADILSALDRWDEWKAMRAAPARIDALEKRLAALEEPTKRGPGKLCEKCGAYAMIPGLARPTTIVALQAAGVEDVPWKCHECDHEIVKRSSPLAP